MHICFIGEYPHQGQPVGGISMYIRNTVQLLLEQGHRVSVLSFSESFEGWEHETPFALYRVHPGKWKLFNFWRIARMQQRILKQLHAQHPIDAVETPESGLCFLSKITGVRYVIRLHGGHMFFAKTLGQPMKSWPSFQEVQSFRKADAVVGVSKFVLSQTESICRISSPKHVVFNGVNTALFAPQPHGATAGIDIVFVGWLVPKKGPAFLLEAFRLLAGDYPHLRLHFYGRDTSDADGHSYWQRLSGNLPDHVSARVFYHGNVPNEQLPQIISQAYCCVYPSQMEAMPVAWLEVMACGQLLIGGDAGPAREIIEHGVTGLLCQPTNADEIAAQIRWAIEHEDEVWQIRQHARKVALARFSQEAVLKQNLLVWSGEALVEA